MLGKNKKGQVAVEFILTFSVFLILFILLYRFSLSLASTQLRQYITFMAGRSAASGTYSYSDKVNNINATIDQYTSSDGAISSSLVSEFVCSNNGSNSYQRGNLLYNSGQVNYDLGANAGVACKITTSPMIGSVDFVSEAMIGSDISIKHCKCLLDFKKTWQECLGEGAGNEKSFSDNGC